MSISVNLIVNMQNAFRTRERAKARYHKEKSDQNTADYTDALLQWDLAWNELMGFTEDTSKIVST